MTKKYIVLILSLSVFVTSFAQPADSSGSGLHFDLGFSRNKDINLWPVIKRTVEPEGRDLQVAFTLFRKNLSYTEHTKHSHLLPFYWYDSSASRRDMRLLSLYYPSLFRYTRDTAANMRSYKFLDIAPHINAFEITRASNGMVMQNNLLFFVWHNNNRLKNSSYLVVFPLYWQFNSPQRSSFTLFPFYSGGTYKGGTAKYMAVTPLYWQFNRGTTKKNILFPLWWSKQRPEEYLSHEVLFPLYWHHHSRYSEKTVLFPLWWSGTEAFDSSSHKVLFPVYWQYRDKEYSSFTLLPLFSVGNSPDGKRSHRVVTPLLWHLEDKDKTRNIFFPLWWNKTEYRYGYRTTTNYVFPVFHSYRNSKEVRLRIYPVWWYNNSYTNTDRAHVIFPVYWSFTKKYTRNRVYFPLVWDLRNSSYRSFTFLPFFSYGRSPDSSRKHYAVTALYWHYQSKYSTRDIFFPLYWAYKGSDRTNKVFFPLVWSMKNRNYESLTVLPLFSYGKGLNNKRSHYSIAGLYWHFEDGKYKTRNFLFPIWWYKEQRFSTADKPSVNRSNVIFPLYWSYSHDNGAISRKVLFPLLWSYRSPSHRSFTFFPMFSYGKYYPGSHLVVTPLYWQFDDGDKRTRILFPLWWDELQKTGSDLSHRSAFFPLYFSYRDPYRSSLTLLPFIFARSDQDYRSFTVVPFFSSGHSVDGLKGHMAITPLYWRFKNGDRHFQTLFPLWWSSRYLDNRVNIFFPLYWSFSSSTSERTVLFPLLWQKRTDNFRSFTLFPLFSYGSSTDHSRAHLVITPLFWKIKRDGIRRLSIIPFYNSYQDETGLRKSDILFFLYRQKTLGERKTFSFIWPLCEFTKDSAYRYFRFAPLVWYKRSPEHNYLAIVPLYYQGRSEKQLTYRVCWQLFTYENHFNEKVSRNFLWRVVSWNRYSDRDHSFRVVYQLFSHVDHDGYRERSFFPLYFYKHDAKGNRTLSFVAGFFSSTKRLVPETTEYYREIKVLWFIRVVSNYRALKAKGIGNKIR